MHKLLQFRFGLVLGKDYTYVQSTYTFTFINKRFCLEGVPSTITLGYADKEKDCERYQGVPYMTIWIDEAQQLDKSVYDKLMGSLQNEKYPGEFAKVLLTANPGGVGHRWIKKYFVQESTRLSATRWIKSHLQDNVWMGKSDPQFANRMREDYADKPWLLAQWLDGDWDVTEDGFFTFNKDRNVKDIEIPHYARWFCGADYGYSVTPFAVIWGAVWHNPYTNERFCHIAHEYRKFKLDMDVQAQYALDMEERYRIPPDVARYADPATRARTEHNSSAASKTVAQAWAAEGWYTIPSNKVAKHVGLQIINGLLTKGILTISPSCVSLINEIEDAVYARNPDGTLDDVTDPRQPDDMTDALRYAIQKIWRHAWGSESTDPWELVTDKESEE
jgi:phage terminase large subunit